MSSGETYQSLDQPLTPTMARDLSVHPIQIHSVSGLCGPEIEVQVKEALASKDRMFVLILGQEIEAFLANLRNGTTSNLQDESVVPQASSSALASLGANFPVKVQPTSTFQRMLAYKVAEWYGMKALPGGEGMVIGIQGELDQRR